MKDLLAAIAGLQSKPPEVVSDTFAENGLVRLLVRADSRITVEIDPHAAKEFEADEIEQHLIALVRAAPVPVPEEPEPEPEPDEPPPPSNADIIAGIRDRKR